MLKDEEVLILNLYLSVIRYNIMEININLELWQEK